MSAETILVGAETGSNYLGPETPPQDPKKRTSCGGCSVTWHQRGNETGHCAQCHRCFDSLRAFELHQRVGEERMICLDPASMVKRGGEEKFANRIDGHGTEYWRISP